MPSDPSALVAAALDGDRRALARLVSIVEDGRPDAGPMLAAAYPAAGGAYRVGITGAPGAGKSTLTDGLIGALRAAGDAVAVLAVDPTSPFSGGAVLGDRVRMQDHVSDDGVYIRSMASRGHLGGLSAAAPKALALLDAAGFPWLLIETVGVGQDEVEITEAADTTIVVVTPGWGDGIQAAKAGILEIGDVFVVNKADRPGLRDTVSDLKTMLQLGGERPWKPPIVETVAAEGAGIEDVREAIATHRRHLEETGGLADGRRRRRIGELEGALAAEYRRRAGIAVAAASGGGLVEAVARGEADPWSAALRMLDAGGPPAR
ncbi:MAG: methylmalonyl Co-A mutase-associated GTPase MeaB [Actinobacteria bacterium]|nr:methylmalonyl Co-A mutase-associated GTPase MeaB [Actinomycetota bacterium]